MFYYKLCLRHIFSQSYECNKSLSIEDDDKCLPGQRQYTPKDTIDQSPNKPQRHREDMSQRKEDNQIRRTEVLFNAGYVLDQRSC